MDCGPTCLRMIAAHYGRNIAIDELRRLSANGRQGSNLMSLSAAAEAVGFRTLGVKLSVDQIDSELSLPCIAHWNNYHFVVILSAGRRYIRVADPAFGVITYTRQEFAGYFQREEGEGRLLLLETAPGFHMPQDPKADGNSGKKMGFAFLSKYLFRYKRLMLQLMVGLLAGSLLQFLFPFLMQSIVDTGVQNRDVDFIYLVLMCQLMLFFGRTTIDVIRNWILLHMSTRINISMVSDFFAKLMRLPISFFDVKMTGDIMQRIGDHQRIESFMTSTALNLIFSIANLIVFSVILAGYSLSIFAVFVIGSLMYFFWITGFLKARAALDYKRFHQNARKQGKVIELINGMQEIKLHNAERMKRWEWERIQIGLFRLGIKGMRLGQLQNVGSGFINELKNILITFLSARLVIDGELSLGMMLSISYIIGQLNGPVTQLVGFTQNLQDARLSMDRLSDIHSRPEEEQSAGQMMPETGQGTELTLSGVTFCYPGKPTDTVLKDIQLTIPANKITAIVGASGSGKTTLMKLLLKIYEPDSGNVKLGSQDLSRISPAAWRRHCGVVMQDGFIFSDSIRGNIAVGVEQVDEVRLRYATEIANIRDFVDSLPLGFDTRIGMEGIGLSAGQKQRLLIARAVYKNPEYLFFDEATSALDTKNEKTIMDNLSEYCKGRTVVVIAHRLSTVKNADQIVVMNNGAIVEVSTHSELVARRGFYFELVRNQLELNN